MGIPLNRIPDIRKFYGRDADDDSAIDLEEDYVLPERHLIAAGSQLKIQMKDSNQLLEVC